MLPLPRLSSPQGYFLTPAATTGMALCAGLTHVRLERVDLRGPVFEDLARLPACTHLELAQVRA